MPVLAAPPTTSSTDQVTEVAVEPLITARKPCVAPTITLAVEGSIVRWAVTLTCALPLAVLSAWLVAVTVCVPAADGAVYTPFAVIVPACALPPATPSTDQVTPVVLELFTVA